jgi:hypothetical protein
MCNRAAVTLSALAMLLSGGTAAQAAGLRAQVRAYREAHEKSW